MDQHAVQPSIPVAVDPPMQWPGIGSAMLTSFCSHMDAYESSCYAETDRPENIRFYRKFSFTVTTESKVLGVSNWFMSRPGRSNDPIYLNGSPAFACAKKKELKLLLAFSIVEFRAKRS